MEQIPTWAVPLLGVLGVVMLVFNVIAIVFVFSYLFFWKRMKSWFNKRAGEEFMPEKRIGKPQVIAAAVGAVLAIVLAVAGLSGSSAEAVKLTPMTLVLALVQWGGLIWFVLYCRKRYLQNVNLVGTKVAKWSMIYLLLSCAAIVVISAMLSTYVMILYATLFIFDKAWDFSSNSSSGSDASGSAPQYKCCRSCRRYSYSQCSENPGDTISDPDHHSCGSHTF